MQEIILTPATVILLAVIAALAALAVCRIVKRGLCDCDDHCGGCRKGKGHSACRGCSSNGADASQCSACPSADKLVRVLSAK